MKNSIEFPPVFIVGVDRSGTTLLNMMLNCHPDFLITYELRVISNFFSRLSGYGDLKEKKNQIILIKDIIDSSPVNLAGGKLSVSDFRLSFCHNFSAIVEEFYRILLKRANKRFWGDKDPLYTGFLEVLNELFPICKFVHIVRDGRDVALSLAKQKWGPSTFPSALLYWRIKAATACKMLAMLPKERAHQIKFENLVLYPEETLQQLCDFLKVDYYQGMLTKYSSNALDILPTNIQSIHKNLSRAPSVDQIYKWKHCLSAADMAIAQEIAGETLIAFGYEPCHGWHYLKPFRKLYYTFEEAYRWRKQLFANRKD